MIWSRAKVVSIFEDKLLIKFLNDFSKNNKFLLNKIKYYFFSLVIKSSGEIAPSGKYSTDFEWRLTLKVFR